ncbi:hemerythrin domain-containing protein [Tahibacter amnicola]|uniref:Hemerythrin domain-containing protein n=1 Tax=Tahibacter amnicola TaxID=2976241 RepID=A0ABY6B9E2_9GAMM|nr:hemerythrin domain-containing protein [Tahibacter amnicola]UXI66495.1 hemerythrin domain-containing protein [Tahibacter amnicola]
MLFSSKSETHAVNLLKRDHRLVEDLFRQWEEAPNNGAAAKLVSQICQALVIHAEVEETVFYPRVLNALDKEDAELIREAAVEHGTLKGLISLLNGASPNEPMFCAQVSVLQEYVKHHVQEEEHELFPAAERTDLDLEALGVEMSALKRQLEARVADEEAPATSGRVNVVDVATPVGARPRGRPVAHGHRAA